MKACLRNLALTVGGADHPVKGSHSPMGIRRTTKLYLAKNYGCHRSRIKCLIA